MKLLDELVEASGLSPLFAKSAIKRAIDRCNVRLDHVSLADVEPLVDDLRRVVAVFEPTHAESAAARIRAVLRRHA